MSLRALRVSCPPRKQVKMLGLAGITSDDTALFGHVLLDQICYDPN